MSEAIPGAGNVPIILDGDDYVLKPTPRAALALSRSGGDGLMGVTRRCGQFDLDQIIAVIAAGLGLTGQGSKDLPEKVWKTGATELAAPCIRYVHILANGGRPPSSDGGEGAGPPLQAD